MRLKGKGTSQKKKRCVKSTAYPCGFACINIKDKCHNVLRGQAATYVLWLGKTEERLAKINAHRSARGKDRIGLVENKGLSKLPRERSPLVEGIISGKVEPIATTELGNAAREVFKGKVALDQKLADMEAASKERLRKIKRQSSKNDYAFTDNPETNKALDKALRGNNIALERFIKRLKETDLDTAVSEVLSQKTPGKQTGSVDELAARRKTQQQPDNVVPFGKKETEKGNPDLVPKPPVKSKPDNATAIAGQGNVEDISNARFNSKLKKGDVVGAIDDAIRTSNEASDIAKKGIADLERSQSEMEQKFDEVRAKYRLLGEPDPEADAAQARIDARKKAKEDELKAKVVPIGKKEKPSSTKSKPTREQLIAEENRLGKELDALFNKTPTRRTPEQQREIDAKNKEYQSASLALRNFDGGKAVTSNEAVTGNATTSSTPKKKDKREIKADDYKSGRIPYPTRNTLYGPSDSKKIRKEVTLSNGEKIKIGVDFYRVSGLDYNTEYFVNNSWDKQSLSPQDSFTVGRAIFRTMKDEIQKMPNGTILSATAWRDGGGLGGDGGGDNRSRIYQKAGFSKKDRERDGMWAGSFAVVMNGELIPLSAEGYKYAVTTLPKRGKDSLEAMNFDRGKVVTSNEAATGDAKDAAIATTPKKAEKQSSSSETSVDDEVLRLENEVWRKEMAAGDHLIGGYTALNTPKVWERERMGLDRRIKSGIKKAELWADGATDGEITKQKKAIASAERKLEKTTEEGWLDKNIQNLVFEGPHLMMPSPEYERAMLSAMQGDMGKALESYYDRRKKEIASKTSKGVDYKKVAYHADRAREYEVQQEDFLKAAQQLKTGSILGIKLTGNTEKDYEKVKASYRKLVKKHHPDVGGDPAEFRKVQAEWETFALRRGYKI